MTGPFTECHSGHREGARKVRQAMDGRLAARQQLTVRKVALAVNAYINSLPAAE